MQYQMDQLFVQSIGADGISLGRYSYTTAKFDEQKKGGQPFSMIDTQDFFNRMFIKVNRVNIEIGSRTTHLEQMLENKSFLTTDFFGITTENEIRLKTLITKHLGEWIVNGISD